MCRVVDSAINVISMNKGGAWGVAMAKVTVVYTNRSKEVFANVNPDKIETHEIGLVSFAFYDDEDGNSAGGVILSTTNFRYLKIEPDETDRA